MDTAIETLDARLIQYRSSLTAIQLDIFTTNDLIENMKKSKREVEASIKDIELALSLLRKI